VLSKTVERKVSLAGACQSPWGGLARDGHTKRPVALGCSALECTLAPHSHFCTRMCAALLVLRSLGACVPMACLAGPLSFHAVRQFTHSIPPTHVATLRRLGSVSSLRTSVGLPELHLDRQITLHSWQPSTCFQPIAALDHSQPLRGSA
jgi:hypothetical protein